jgi:hypothetical protein
MPSSRSIRPKPATLDPKFRILLGAGSAISVRPHTFFARIAVRPMVSSERQHVLGLGPGGRQIAHIQGSALGFLRGQRMPWFLERC